MALLLVMAAARASAGGLALAPIRLDIAAGERAAVLDVSNADAAATDVQVRVQQWSQLKDEDVYAITDDVVVSPPRFTLAADGRQTVRIYLHQPAGAGPQRTYRVFVDQIPAIGAATDTGSVRLPMRALLPLFVQGGDGGTPDLHWQARRRGAGIELTLRNSGSKAIRIGSLSATAEESAAPAQPLLLYALAGAERTLQIDAPQGLDPSQTTIVLHGDSDAGPLHASVALANGP